MWGWRTTAGCSSCSSSNPSARSRSATHWAYSKGEAYCAIWSAVSTTSRSSRPITRMAAHQRSFSRAVSSFLTERGYHRAMSPRSRRRRLLPGLLLLVGGLLLIEGLARLVDPQLPGMAVPQTTEGGLLMAGHSTRLWSNHASGTRETGETTALINAEGLRGELPELPRPAERERLMVIGDSTAFGHGVPDGTAFVNVAGRILAESGLDVDVVNGGVAGYSIAQSGLFMEEQGWAMEPTLLVINNLWSDNTFDAFHDENLLASRALAQKNPLAHSDAVRLLATAFGRLMPQETGRIVTVSGLGEWPEGKVRRVPVPRYALLLDALIDEARSRGVGVAFVRNANERLLHGWRDETPPTWEPYFEVMEALADHHSVPMVDASTVFLGSGLEQDGLFLDVMHPTVAGHELIGTALAEQLLASGWPEKGLLGSTEAFSSEIEDIEPPADLYDQSLRSRQQQLFEPF